MRIYIQEEREKEGRGKKMREIERVKERDTAVAEETARDGETAERAE